MWKASKTDFLLDALTDFASKHHAFELSIQNFAAFVPRVIFLDVLKSAELLQLQKELVAHMKRNLHLQNANYKARGFNPHLTLAFRDLKKSLFDAAYQEVKDKKYSAIFTVNQIALLKHKDQQWELFKSFALQDPASGL